VRGPAVPLRTGPASGSGTTRPAHAVAAATRAADTAREGAARYLLAARLERLRERTAARTGKTTPWTERLPCLAARTLNDDATGTVV
jgi:hypothetical protein